MSDWRYALRTLWADPGFTAVAVLLLALGIGANCVIFSALDALLLRRLPVRRPEELVRLVQNKPPLPRNSYISLTTYSALAARAGCFSDVFGHEEINVAFSDAAGTERIRAHLVTKNYFAAL